MDELHTEAERLRVDFLNADLDIAFTFLKLARRELEYGDCHHFDDLMKRTCQAIDTVERLMTKLPAGQAGAVQKRLKGLRSALRKTETARSETKAPPNRLPVLTCLTPGIYQDKRKAQRRKVRRFV